MPTDELMDIVNNEEPLYNEVQDLYASWMRSEEDMDKKAMLRSAVSLAMRLAQEVENIVQDGRYSGPNINDAAKDILDGYDEYREYAIKKAMERATRKPKPEDLEMTPGDTEHAKKYEALAQKIGIDTLKSLIPASREKIHKALQSGDKHLNDIPLRKWDAASAGISFPGLSLSEKVCALKHVARWHY